MKNTRLLMTGMDWLPDSGSGGLNRYFFDQIQAFSRLGIRGIALASSVSSPGTYGGFDVRAMAHPHAPMHVRMRGVRTQVRSALQSGEVGIVNAHFAVYAAPWLSDLPENVPLIVNFQGPWCDEMQVGRSSIKTRVRGFLAERIERRVYQHADRIITLSEAFKELVQTRFHVAPERVSVVPGAADTRRYRAAPERRIARERLGWPQDRKILLAVRRLDARMGLENLIEAMVSIRSAVPDALLLIGGKGLLHSELERRIEAGGLRDHVRLLGFVGEDELPLAYAASDLGVVPTIALEGFGLITVESLAAGTPVMGTPIGGTPEILRDFDKRLIFASPSPEHLASGLIGALTGLIPLPDAEACRAYAMRYDWEAVAPRLVALYQKELDQKRSG